MGWPQGPSLQRASPTPGARRFPKPITAGPQPCARGSPALPSGPVSPSRPVPSRPVGPSPGEGARGPRSLRRARHVSRPPALPAARLSLPAAAPGPARPGLARPGPARRPPASAGECGPARPCPQPPRRPRSLGLDFCGEPGSGRPAPAAGEPRGGPPPSPALPTPRAGEAAGAPQRPAGPPRGGPRANGSCWGPGGVPSAVAVTRVWGFSFRWGSRPWCRERLSCGAASSGRLSERSGGREARWVSGRGIWVAQERG